jgi:hypothetical protein
MNLSRRATFMVFWLRCSRGRFTKIPGLVSNQDSEVKKINDKMIVALCKQSLLEKSLANIQ